MAADPPLRLHRRPSRRLHAHARRLSLVAALVAVALVAGASRAAPGHSYAIAGPIDSISLSAAGGRVAQAGAISDGRPAGNAVVGQAGTTVRTYSATGLGRGRTLPKGGRLAGVSGGLAVYVTPSQVHVLRLADGRDRLLATAKRLEDAQITPAGVFYAAVQKPAYNGVITFVPLARVLRKLR
jgi:hypothetical protein